MLIREAGADDWPGIWAIIRPVVEAGETFTWDRDVSQERARAMWTAGHAYVAVDESGAVLATAELHRNQGGPGSHVANAGFMVSPSAQGRGVGRALCAHVLQEARRLGYRAMQFNAVVETNVRAVRLWQSLGFEILTTVPEAFHHPNKGFVGLHVMYLKL
ncbi:GNAT family N-acetyltransferase [Allorhizocola rhizosphaerae]|uniref:GNAT family N-acetyltransferase n=1 Tax=Allorhizocola rhizosphaerae TaxID=1872709 RepID=UPI000E3B7BAA|nr:GNAT family N-acetyltransferase [Allorhizocola rhizosphaerae]